MLMTRAWAFFRFVLQVVQVSGLGGFKVHATKFEIVNVKPIRNQFRELAAGQASLPEPLRQSPWFEERRRAGSKWLRQRGGACPHRAFRLIARRREPGENRKPTPRPARSRQRYERRSFDSCGSPLSHPGGQMLAKSRLTAYGGTARRTRGPLSLRCPGPPARCYCGWCS